MKLEELKELYKGCSTYDAQYLPTFRQILNALNSENVEDIVNKYDEYINIIPGLNTSTKKKHIRSLCHKLKPSVDIQEHDQEEEHATEEICEEEDGESDDELSHHNNSVQLRMVQLLDKVKYLENNNLQLQEQIKSFENVSNDQNHFRVLLLEQVKSNLLIQAQVKTLETANLQLQELVKSLEISKAASDEQVSILKSVCNKLLGN